MTRFTMAIEHLTAAATGVILALTVGLGGAVPTQPHQLRQPPRTETGTTETASTDHAQPFIRPGPTADGAVKPRIPVEVLRVIDGDTVEVRAQIWLDQHVTTKVRIRAIDAPERQSRCTEEKIRAEASREQLVGLIGKGDAFLTDLGRDKYGSRVLGTLLTVTGLDVGMQMVKDGHARLYAGGKRTSWC